MNSAELVARFEGVESEVSAACRAAARTRGSVVVVGVIKGQPPAAVDAYISWCRAHGQPAVLGVNYIQEFRAIRPQLVTSPDSVHFIGRLQRNKAKDAVALCDVVETVDSLELAQALDRAAEKSGRVIDVLLQVNISGDEHKAGLTPVDVAPVARTIGEFAHLRLGGLMTITRLYETAAEARPDFTALAALRDSLDPNLVLSMGMSLDFGEAIGAGSRFVRLGTALFGERAARGGVSPGHAGDPTTSS